MWGDPRHEESNFNHVFCPRCHKFYEKINFELSPGFAVRKCKICNKAQEYFKCTFCEYRGWLSPCVCVPSSSFKKLKKENKKFLDEYNISILKSIPDSHFKLIPFVVIIIILIIFCYFNSGVGNNEGDNAVLIEKLKKDYPSQKKETWYHFLGILEKQIPSVKSIIFLHGKDKETSDCLANELVLLYTKNKNLKKEEITFSNFKADDYGFILEHYHKVVKKSRVFITDLNKVSGNVARIFHSLCDEVSSDIKPSLFIFTLKYEGRTENLRPIERATSLLRKTWSDLPESELSPLLSRVVKNVVDIVPEYQINC